MCPLQTALRPSPGLKLRPRSGLALALTKVELRAEHDPSIAPSPPPRAARGHRGSRTPLAAFQVKNVAEGASMHDETATLAYSEKPISPVNAPASAYGYPRKENGYYAPEAYNPSSSPARVVSDQPARTFSTSTLEERGRESSSKPAARRGRRRRRNPELDESQYETDYTTAMESSDERDKDEWGSVYPPITSDGIRQEYKQEFDADLKHYKRLCAEMDDINDQLNQLSKQLDGLSEDSPQYQVRAGPGRGGALPTGRESGGVVSR
uniref:OCEL domain-containing protein n=1 Tax=Chelydra serpentina TaxID=8475 RepID=A0A8C3XQQ2_CHESE